MNSKHIGLALVMAAFLAGAFVSVLDPEQVNWTWMSLCLAAGATGLWMFRSAHHAEARSGERVTGNMEVLGGSLKRILANLESLYGQRDQLPVYEARFEIDSRFREDLNAFADARESMIHVFGMQQYADVMSAFAAGERYINRIWTASTDGYVDEVMTYLERARDQFREANALFDRLVAEQGLSSPAGTPAAS